MKAGADGGGCFPTGRHYPGIAHLMRVVTVGIAPGFDPGSAWLDLPLVCIDTETTGRDAAQDRVVELACVYYRQGAIAERRSWLFNPGRPIPPESTSVHGIRDEDVASEPPFGELAPTILAAFAGSIPVAYNAEFDRAFVLAELGRAGVLEGDLPPAARDGVEWVDPLVWARELQKEEKSRALGDVCARLGIDTGRAHRAADDAEATLRVLLEFSQDARVPRQYSAFVQEQRRLARAFEDARRMWRSRSA
jgi:DNA polymerase III subunit epsilon